MDLFGIITLLIALSATFGYLNVKFLKLPQTIGLMIIAVGFSLAMLAFHYTFPDLFRFAETVIEDIDLSKVIMEVMLCFILFAGALHTDVGLIRSQGKTILQLAIVSTLVSTFLIGGLMYGVTYLLGYPLHFIYCLLFGALISPTDPIAVLSILTKSKVPKNVETNIVGESLFNDGVAVVIFATILQLIRSGHEAASLGDILLLFLQEAGGGVAFGMLLGYVMFILLRSIDHYETEVMITIAMVMGGYHLAHYLHVSGPLAIVVAGLLTGGKAGGKAMSEHTQLYVFKFWELVDLLMNAILFVLIGLRLMILDYSTHYLVLGLIGIPMVLLARWLSIRLPFLLSRRWIKGVDRSARLLMVWGGLRGGISIALAMSLSRNEEKDMLVFITYVIVLFSIIVQGLTLERVARRVYKTAPETK